MQYYLGDSATISASEESIKKFLGSLSSMSRDKAVQVILEIGEKAWKAVTSAKSGGPNSFTSAKAQNIADLVTMLMAGVDGIQTFYSDTDFASVYPAQWQRLGILTQDIKDILPVIQQWNPALGDTVKSVRDEMKKALAEVDLDHPFVGPNLKNETIKRAYDSGSNLPIYQKTREKYTRGGTLKSGGEQRIYTQAEREQAISAVFTKAGVTPPVMSTTAPATVPTSGAGIGAGTLVAAGVAAIVAFFALR